MKNIVKNAFILFTSFALIFGTFSCSNLNTDEKLSIEEIKENNSEAYLKINIEDFSRSVMPQVSESDFNFITLAGGGISKTGTATEPVLKTWTSFSDMLSDTISLEKGYTYTLILTASDKATSSFSYSATSIITTTEGKNKVTFTLQPKTFSNEGNGSINITVNVPTDFNGSIKAGLVENITDTPTSFDELTSNDGAFLYSKSEVTSGKYYAIFKLYDSNGNEINTARTVVYVANGLESVGSVNINVLGSVDGIVETQTEITVSNWDNLKDAIENGTASTILIDAETITAGAEAITVKRAITIKPNSNSIEITATSGKNVFITGSGGALTLDGGDYGFELVGSGDTSNTYALLSMEGGNFTLSNVKIHDNTANTGAAIGSITGTSKTGNLTITNCEFYNCTNNATGDGGGAVYLKNIESCNISNSKFYSNSAKYGGAVYIEGANTSVLVKTAITDSYFYGNEAVTSGGALYLKNVANINDTTISASISNTKFGITENDESSPNKITSTDSTQVANGGAAIWIGGTATKVSLDNDTEIKNNTSSVSGGGIYVNAGTLSVNNATISNNSATKNGGGICITSTTSPYPSLTLESGAKIYDNNATTSGKNLYTSTTNINVTGLTDFTSGAYDEAIGGIVSGS